MKFNVMLFIVLSAFLSYASGTETASGNVAYAEYVRYARPVYCVRGSSASFVTNSYPVCPFRPSEEKCFSWTNSVQSARMLDDSALRFDVLNPHPFSRMGAIRTKARELYRKGESTDALWARYWELYYKQMKDSE